MKAEDIELFKVIERSSENLLKIIDFSWTFLCQSLMAMKPRKPFEILKRLKGYHRAHYRAYCSCHERRTAEVL